MNWENSTQYLVKYPKTKLEDPSVITETLHRTVNKRRTSHQSTDHELEDHVNEWANMTGFLCALGSVCLQNKSHRSRSELSVSTISSVSSMSTMTTYASIDSRKSSVLPGCGDMQYCPVTQYVG